MDIGSWIPQVFYDLIGRILPGTFLLVLVWLLFSDDEGSRRWMVWVSESKGFPTTIALTLGLAIAYTVGAILGGVGSTVKYLLVKKPTRGLMRAEVPPEFVVEPTLLTSNKARTAGHVSFMYDFIQRHDSAAGARQAKLRAEIHMCYTLMLGSIVLSVAIFATKGFGWGSAGIAMLLTILGASAYFLSEHLELRSRQLLENYWLLLRHPSGSVRKKS